MTTATTTKDQQLAQRFDGCLGTAARMIDRVITSTFEEALRPLDVKPNQVTLLASVAALGDATQRDLAPVLRIDQTTLSRTLRKLVERGLLYEVDHDDQRVAPYRLSPAGRALLKKAQPLWNDAQHRVETLLGPRAANSLRNAATSLSGDADG